ncbi:DUF983 domain-containing protein [Mongoliitalea lutea]|uniref:DUF983 domain-containing protein n=1 Tax=Mongoliitalea lutea TaxID=849756 RepID=A0A8J3D011_9BACT|nr:DUF983 domain-containing protein [Mongoliitalea lutea]GHB50326.1 hypothetical protein GCM10008106_33940 [Mongoliitalea lutea]
MEILSNAMIRDTNHEVAKVFKYFCTILSVMEQVSLSKAMLHGKCPRCREGNMFPTSLMSYTKLTEVHHKCPTCNAVLTPEPDFFYGAMYISYAFSVALMVSIFVAINVLFGRSPLSYYVITIIVFNVILVPLMLRYSKVLYLYGVGKLTYDPQWKGKKA